MERSVLQGLAAFRWGAWLWMATVLLVSRDQLTRPFLAVALVGAALAVTVVDTALLRRDPARLMTAGPVLAELGVGMALLVCDGVVYGEASTPSPRPSRSDRCGPSPASSAPGWPSGRWRPAAPASCSGWDG